MQPDDVDVLVLAMVVVCGSTWSAGGEVRLECGLERVLVRDNFREIILEIIFREIYIECYREC